ncbi:MAG: insulinase family protein [Bacteroidota bacterium]
MVTGQLENGLVYYINPKGETGKVKLTMQSKVGALVETKDEHGYAHFLEHMMFNGSENYPGRSCYHVMEDMGMRLGVEFTAFTSSTDTEYNLIIPDNNEAYLRESLLLFKDWMFFLDMKQETLDHERKIIKEEINRGGTPASYMLYGTELEGHDVLGDKSSIDKVNLKQLTGFYKKYYRPDMLAVIIYGEIDEKVALKTIQEVFGTISEPTTEKPRLFPDVSGNNVIDRTRLLGTSGNRSRLSVLAKYPAKEISSREDFRSVVAVSVFKQIMDRRLSGSYTGSYVSGQWRNASFLPHTSFMGAEIFSNNGSSYKDMLNDLCYAFAQAKEHGFSQEEIDYAVRIQMNWKEKSRNREVLELGEIKSGFLRNSVILSGKEKYELYKNYTKTLKPADMEAITDLFLASKKIVSLDSTSAAYSGDLTDNYVWNQLASIDSIDTEPYLFKSPPAPVGDEDSIVNLDDQFISKPAPGLLRKEHVDKNLVLLEYGNGAKVVLHRNPREKVSVKIVSHGGLNLIPVSDRALFMNMLRYLGEGYAGISGETAFQLERACGIYFSEKADHYSHQVEMKGTREHFKEMCQVLNLRLTEANELSEEAFEEKLSMAKRYLMIEQDIEYKEYKGRVNLSRVEIGLDTSNVAECAGRFTKYRNRLVDQMNHGVVYISGDLPERAEEYITAYLASVFGPENELEVPGSDPDILADEVVMKQFTWRRTVSIVEYLFTTIPDQVKLKDYLILEGIARHANNMMLKKLRAEHGLVYSTGTTAYTRTYPDDFTSLSIRYMIDPENIDTSLIVMNDLLDGMSTGTISLKETDRIKALLQTIFITSFYDPETLSTVWADMFMSFDKAFSRDELQETIHSISPEDIQSALHRILQMKNHYILIRRPESTSGKTIDK